MKKSVSALFFALGLTTAMIACAGKKNDNTVLGSGLANNCLVSSAACNSAYYDQNQNYGFAAYPVNYGAYGGYVNYWMQMYGGYGSSGYAGYNPYGSYNPYGYNQYSQYNNGANSLIGFCECENQSGNTYTTVYSNVAGLGCVRNQVISQVQNAVGTWMLNSSTQQWVNTSQGVGTTSYSYSSCNRPAIQACVLSANEGCSAGFSCRAISGGGIGICVR